MEKLKNKKFLITGATGYFGRVISEQIANEGADIILLSNNFKRLKLVKKSLEKKYDSHIDIIKCNLFDLKSIKKISKQLSKEKYINGLVNCAYSGVTGDIKNISEKDFLDATKINIIAPYLLIKALKKKFVQTSIKFNELSSIVNIASIYGIISPEKKNYKFSKDINPIHYGSSKSAMIQLSKYLACNLNSKHIRVNSVSPGAFPNFKNKNKNNLSRIKSRIPLGRFGLPIEVARPVIFLLSNDSSYITGSNLIVDGGWISW